MLKNALFVKIINDKAQYFLFFLLVDVRMFFPFQEFCLCKYALPWGRTREALMLVPFPPLLGIECLWPLKSIY